MIQRIDIRLMMTLGWMTPTSSTSLYKEIRPCRAVKSSMSSWIRNFPKIETLYSPSGYLEPHKSKSLDSFWTPKIISVYIWLIMHDVKDDITALHSRISLHGDDDDVGLVHPSNIIKKTETELVLHLESYVFFPKGWVIATKIPPKKLPFSLRPNGQETFARDCISNPHWEVKKIDLH